MKAIITNWKRETLDDSWFAEHGEERDSDIKFFEGSRSYPLAEIPFFFSVECTPAPFVLFMGQLLGAAVRGEIDIAEPNTLLPLASILASPLDDEIEVTPDWYVNADAVSKFACARGIAWAGDHFEAARGGRVTGEQPTGSTRRSAETRSRDTLLSIINAMADQLGIDPTERGSAARIAAWTEHVGAPVGEETIKKYLDMIPDTIERRSK